MLKPKKIMQNQLLYQNILHSYGLIRPFTLIAPAAGIIFGGLTAIGTVPLFNAELNFTFRMVYHLIIGSLAAALLNAGSNSWNQLYDITEDRVNKPDRPLVSGKLTVKTVQIISVSLYLVALILAFTINRTCFLFYSIAVLLTIFYSTPPIRFKKRGVCANLIIALVRGLLLFVCGWATIKPVDTIEPWFIGSIFFLFILGASSTKDFSDVEGDRVAGIRSFPLRFGERKAAVIISPFLVFPFLLIPLGVHFGYLSANTLLLYIFTILLITWGFIVAMIIVKNPTTMRNINRNHVSWFLMYGLMIFCQMGFAIIYLVSN